MKRSEWEASESQSKISAGGCLLSGVVVTFIALLGAAMVGVLVK